MSKQNEEEKSIEQPMKRKFRRKYFTKEQKKKKLCCLCGEKVNKQEEKFGDKDKTWNLDYSKDIVCDTCLLRVKKTPRQNDPKDSTDIHAVYKLYQTIKARKIISIPAIEVLERVTKSEFRNTKTFV